MTASGEVPEFDLTAINAMPGYAPGKELIVAGDLRGATLGIWP